MNNKEIEKVTQFLNKEFVSKLGDVAIFQNEDGDYEFFNRYVISKANNGYDITLKYGSEIVHFSSLKSAVTWCIFDLRNKIVKTKRIEYLDKMVSGAELNIELHKKLVKKAKDLESKFIYLAKLSEDENKRKSYLLELSRYITESKILQTQNFTVKR